MAIRTKEWNWGGGYLPKKDKDNAEKLGSFN